MSVRSLRNSVHNAFVTIHLFRDCFARNFKDSLVQRFWDTLAVRIVRWATIISPTRVLSNDLSTRKPKCSRVPWCFTCQTDQEAHCFHRPIEIKSSRVYDILKSGGNVIYFPSASVLIYLCFYARKVIHAKRRLLHRGNGRH